MPIGYFDSTGLFYFYSYQTPNSECTTIGVKTNPLLLDRREPVFDQLLAPSLLFASYSGKPEGLVEEVNF
jgi:hypothetical protein